MYQLIEFNRCNQAEKVALVLEQGHYIQLRVNGNYSIVLYSLGRFFAEIWYRTATDRFFMVRGFNNSDMLEPYLEVIDLTELSK